MFKTKLSETGTGIALLLLRILSGGFMLTHGYGKFLKMDVLKSSFPDPIGVGNAISLYMALTAELLCAALLLIGLGTRLVVIPLIILMAVAVFKIHAADALADKELAIFYLVIYFALFISGPGKFSADKYLLKK